MKIVGWVTISIVIIILVVGAILLIENNNFSNKNSNEKNNNVVSDNSGIGATKEYNIEIKNFAFFPSILTIKAGTTITWTNSDSVSHTVTSDSGSELNSDLFSKGQTYSHTFNIVGTYNYHCKPHPSMKGVIIVQ